MNPGDKVLCIEEANPALSQNGKSPIKRGWVYVVERVRKKPLYRQPASVWYVLMGVKSGVDCDGEERGFQADKFVAVETAAKVQAALACRKVAR